MQINSIQANSNTLILGLGVSGLSCLKYFSSLVSDTTQQNVNHKREIFAYDDNLATNADWVSDLRIRYPNIKFISEKEVIPFYKIDACIASPGISDEHSVVKRFLQSEKPVICDIELFAQKNFLPTVAITGTNGKSTVVSWLAHVLNTVGKKTILAGNIGVPVLDYLLANEEYIDNYSYVVLELSSFQLERTTSLHNHIALILNISPDHMDRYSDEAAYQAAKERIYSNASWIIVNADAPQFSMVYKIKKTIFSVLESQTDFAVSAINGLRFITFAGERLLEVSKLPLLGEHNLSNALAVLSCIKALNLPLDVEVISALLNFKGLPHRSELVAEKKGVRYINDSKATNADATIAAVSGNINSLILIVGGDSKQADLKPLKDALQGKLKAAIAIGRDAELFVTLFESLVEVIRVSTLEQAVQTANQIAVAGDTVLLSPACSSLDMFDNFKQRGEVFKQAVSELAA